MANFDVSTATPVAAPAGTEESYLVGKKKITLANLKAWAITGLALAADVVRRDGTTAFTAPQPGVDATAAAHLVTKTQLDAVSAAAAAGGGNVKADGSVAFTAVQTGVTPTAAAHLATKSYVDAYVPAGMVKADGSVAFTAVQSGVTPTAAAHLATMGYVDAADAALSVRIAALEAVDLEIGGTLRSGNFNGVLGSREPFTTTAGIAICTPPVPTADGQTFGVIDAGGNAHVNNCTVDFVATGKNFLSGANNSVINTIGGSATYKWSAPLNTWLLV